MFVKINGEFIKKYIKLVTDDIVGRLIIYDDLYILRNSGDFDDVSEISRWHTNEYCMAIKDKGGLHRRCVALKKKFNKKVFDKKSVCTLTCYCGVREIVAPVIVDGKMLAMVSVSGLMGELSTGMKKLLCNRIGISAKVFEELMKNSLVCEDNRERIEVYVESLAFFIGEYLKQSNVLKLGEEVSKRDSEAFGYIETAIKYIDENFTTDISVSDVARKCNLSVSHLQHIFLKETGTGIGDKIRKNRLMYAKQLLRNSNRMVRDIALRCGFKNVDYFSYAFHKEYGITPLNYRKK